MGREGDTKNRVVVYPIHTALFLRFYCLEIIASRVEMKLRSSSFDRGRSQLASSNTSLIVTGSIWLLVVSMLVGCPFVCFIVLCIYLSTNVMISQYPYANIFD